MTRVVLTDEVNLKIVGADTDYDAAQRLACEVFTCAIVAVCRTDKGEMYIRPPETRDTSVFCYAVIAL